MNIKLLICSIFGHSNIQSNFMGYHDCGRRGEGMRDSLMGLYANEKVVIIGHKCKECIANYKKLKWHEKLLTPNPF